MSLEPGDTLGPFQILSALGAGGMGEVYKARDTRLDRLVAVKVLPPHIARREDLRARFEREAKAVSSLNHPHICTLFDAAEHQGNGYMVMEFIEGETLAARIARGPIPLDQALKIARQTASALDCAHRNGVVHRDIKPANIMLAREGVKVLDFGLAKTMPKTIGANDATLTAALTSEGTILGTPYYMPPEQYEGKDADERSDIFSFGCVAYEMITGRPAFDGKTRASVIAAVLGADPPPMSALQPVTPKSLDRVIARCLQKDPEERWQSIRDVMFELEAGYDPAPATAAPPGWPRLPWMAAAAGLALAAVFAALWIRNPVAAPVPPIQFAVEPPRGHQFPPLAQVPLAVSPDGKHLVYGTGGSELARQLWIRPVDSLTARQLPGTESAYYPFWSPDGKSLAFFGGGRLVRMDIATGSTSVVCDRCLPLGPGDWGPDGTILFGSARGIVKVPASGGAPAPATAPPGDGATDTFPQFLADGRRFLYLRAGADSESSGIYAGSIDGSVSPTRIAPSPGRFFYAPPLMGKGSHVLWLENGILMARKFDEKALRLDSGVMPVAGPVEAGDGGRRIAAAVSPSGYLVYRPEGGQRRTRMAWLGDGGKREPLGPEDRLSGLRIAPDGARVALARADGSNQDIWLYEFGNGSMKRLTFDPAPEINPVWSPDGRSILYTVPETRVMEKHIGGGDAERIVYRQGFGRLDDRSPDGRFLLATFPPEKKDIWVLDLTDSKPYEWLGSTRVEAESAFSPNGKWVAYTASLGSAPGIFIRAWKPGAAASGGQWQVSDRGSHPRWSRDGRFVFYQTVGRIVVAAVRETPSGLEVGAPREFASTTASTFFGGWSYDVAPDGRRVLVLEPLPGETETPLTVITNWTALANN